ncbi:MAG: type II toxin-antitoxin system RelE/ParE family toxin [Coleofasciculaceae cyanobacterium RL_1_1]|nr:type II toxin-antitoxin system RelE/ParE family toxin [Coleofasciculaceae cyanobacterium RL_1_1]
MTYRIEFAKRAAKQFSALPKPERQRIATKIDALSADPRPLGVKQLTASDGLYRLRIGTYRVIYTIQAEQLLILVLKIGHRREVYRKR